MAHCQTTAIPTAAPRFLSPPNYLKESGLDAAKNEQQRLQQWTNVLPYFHETVPLENRGEQVLIRGPSQIYDLDSSPQLSTSYQLSSFTFSFFHYYP